MAISGSQILAGALVIELISETKKFAAGMARGQQTVDDFTKKVYAHRQTLEAAGRAMTAFGALVTSGFIDATLQATKFQHGIREIKTLGVDDSLDDIAEATKEVRVQFGQGEAVTKAYYDAVSAGVASASEDVKKHLQVVGKLATVGVADLAAANDLLSNTLNAYHMSVSEATRVSDVLFATVRGGKTTVAELAQHIGRVAPIAANAGLSIEELGASVAASTKPLGSTEMAVTGLRAAIQNILTPTKAAQETASRLGIQFDIAAVKSKGWTQWLNELLEAAKGDTQALSDLFGSVEAKNFVMALASDNATTYNAQLKKMQTAAGLVEENFALMSRSGEFQLNRLRQSFAMLKVEIGENFVQAATRGSKSMADLTESMRKYLHENEGTAEAISMIGVATGGAAMGAGQLIQTLGFLSMIAMATKTSILGIVGTGVAVTGWAVAVGGAIGFVGGMLVSGIGAWREWRRAKKAEEDAAAAESEYYRKLEEKGWSDHTEAVVQVARKRIAFLQQEAQEIRAAADMNVETKNKELSRINELIVGAGTRMLAHARNRGEDTTAIEEYIARQKVDLITTREQDVAGEVEKGSAEQLAIETDKGTQLIDVSRATGEALKIEAQRQGRSLFDLVKEHAAEQIKTLTDLAKQSAERWKEMGQDVQRFATEAPKGIEPSWKEMDRVTTTYMTHMAETVAQGVNAMLAKLKELHAELQNAVGGSWYVDAMNDLVDWSRYGFGGMRQVVTGEIAGSLLSFEKLHSGLQLTGAPVEVVQQAPGFGAAGAQTAGPGNGSTEIKGPLIGTLVVNARGGSPRDIADEVDERLANLLRFIQLRGE